MKRLLFVLILAGCGPSTIDQRPPAAVGSVVPSPPPAVPSPMQATPTIAAAPVAAGDRFALAAEGSRVEFVAGKVTREHRGGWKDVTGHLTWRDGAPTGLAIEIGMDSLYVDNPKLANHLRSDDFFDVDNFPKASFVASGFERAGDGWRVSGDLMLHGVTRPIAFDARLVDDGARIAGTAAFRIDRQQWGVAYRGAPDDLIRDEVALEIGLSFPRG